MARFKSKKKFNNIFIYLGLFLISVALTIKFLYDNDLVNNNTIVDLLISDNLGNYKNNKITDVDFLLKYALNVDLKKGEKEVTKEEDKEEKVEVEKEDTQIDTTKPIIYIYNTHQEEKYQSGTLLPYNITPTIFMASKMLKEYLEDEGIPTLVEENNVADTLRSMNLKYGSSYKVSRMFLEDAKKNNPSLKFYIDLHRDSSIYDKTTTKIDNESYARILFVVGLDNENYEPNLTLAEKLRDRIKAYNEDLYRGIMKKSGKGVNGVYNQDFDPNTVLIEIGGQYNNITEVNNSLKVLAKILALYVKENLL